MRAINSGQKHNAADVIFHAVEFLLDNAFCSAWLLEMKIPAFKPSKRFINDIKLPCLVATVKNSELPGVATQYIAEYKEDPICKIVLRGADSKRISAWQQEILDQLLTNEGLAVAAAEGMKDFEKHYADQCYTEFDDDERQRIKEQGPLPLLTIGSIIIDDVERKLIIGADNPGILDDHGIIFYLDGGHWRFDSMGYLDNYLRPIANEQDAKENDKWNKAWEAIFPPPEPATPVEMDETNLCGVWRYDPNETARVLKQLRASSSQISEALKPRSQTKFFSPQTMEISIHGQVIFSEEVVRYERKGNWFTVHYKERDSDHFWCDGKFLALQSARPDAGSSVFVRVEDSWQKADSSKI